MPFEHETLDGEESVKNDKNVCLEGYMFKRSDPPRKG